MINNTNFTHWNRLQAKSLDSQFVNEMVTGLNCSPFEAEAIVEKVHEIYTPLLETSQGLRPGQIQMTIIDALVAPNVPLIKAKQRLVTLTLHAGQEDIETRKNGSVPELRQKRLCRMCQEAFVQLRHPHPGERLGSLAQEKYCAGLEVYDEGYGKSYNPSQADYYPLDAGIRVF